MRKCVLVLSVLLLAGCGATGGTRAPTPAERTQLVHAMKFWFKNSDVFAAVRGKKLYIGEIRVSKRDSHYATVRMGVIAAEPQQLGYLHVGGVWEIVVGPGDWSGVCTSPSPRPLVDLYCS